MPNLLSQVIRSTIFTYVGIVVGFITQGLFFPSIFSKEQIGLLTLLISLSQVLGQASNLGLNNAGGRYFPYFRNTTNDNSGYLYIAVIGTAIGFLVVCLLLTGAYPRIVSYYQKQSPLFIEYYYFLIPITLFTVGFAVVDNYARLLYDPVTGTVLQQFVQRIFILLSGVLFWFKIVDFYGFMLLWLGSFFFPFFWMTVILNVENKLLLVKPINFNIVLRKDFIKYALMTLTSGLSTQIIAVVDKAMLSSDVSLSQTGIYSVALSFATVIAVPATALYKAASINIAEAWKKRDMQSIELLYRESCLNQLIAGCFIFICIITNLPSVYSYLPNGYDTGYIALLWLGLAKLIDMSTGINGIILYTSRYYGYDTLFFIIMIFITVGLNNLLIPAYGMNGAALGAFLVTLLYNFSRTLFVGIVFKLQPFNWKNLYVVLISIVTWYIVDCIPSYTEHSTILSFLVIIAKALLTFIVYLLILILLNVSNAVNSLYATVLSKFRNMFCRLF